MKWIVPLCWIAAWNCATSAVLFQMLPVHCTKNVSPAVRVQIVTLMRSSAYGEISAFGAAAFGRLFRVYSIATIVVLLVCGAMTGADKSRIEANLSTPWAGLWERINIGFTLLWVAVLAVVLLRTSRETPSDRPAPHDLIRVRRAPPREARRQPVRIEQPPAS